MSKLKLIDLYASDNIADMLDKEDLLEIATDCIEDYEEDLKSRAEFDATMEHAMEIAKQTVKEKNTPWQGASNIKYPLITTAAIQYAARTYPEIVRNNKVVEACVLGDDPTGEGAERASRVSEHMSAQLLVQDPEWEGDMDRLLHVLPIVGTVFKKTYWDEVRKHNRSIMIAPQDLVVNDGIKSIETARCITHVYEMCTNDIIERVRLGLFCDIDEDEQKGDKEDKYSDAYDDCDDTILEQHCYLDLDEDGYEEPYIVTVHLHKKKVLRIYRRFDLQDVYKNQKGEVYRIKACQYFTDFHFLPAPDGGFYSIGFGQLLLPLNETINTTINQLLDAGTLSNSQTGFLSKNFKSTSGSVYLAPGEWKKLDMTGEDMKNGIMPLPVREPSKVLFELLGMMVQTGKELASVSDILQGQQPAQNVPATTVLALIEQGLKVFSGIQKRVFRALKKEFAKLYRLNGIYLNDTLLYQNVLKTLVIKPEDYDPENLTVFPVSDPSMSSDAQRMARAKALLEILPMVPPAGHDAILQNWLDALQTPKSEIQKILPPPDPHAPPPPAVVEQQMKQQELQLKNSQVMMDHQVEIEKAIAKDRLDQSQVQLNQQLILESQARVMKMRDDAATAIMALRLENEQQQVALSIDAVKKIEDLKEDHQAEIKKASKEEMNNGAPTK